MVDSNIVNRKKMVRKLYKTPLFPRNMLKTNLRHNNSAYNF